MDDLTDWVDINTTWLEADDALSSGIATDILRGNSLCVYEQSGYDMCFYPHDSGEFSHGFTLGTYAWFTGLHSLRVPVRRAMGGGMRDYKVEAQGLLGAAGTAVARAYFMASPGADLDATSGLLDNNTYAELKFTDNAAFQTKSATVTSDVPTASGTTGEANIHPADDYVPVPFSFAYLGIAVSTDVTMTLTLRGVRIIEVP